jgi:hypothetical protein
VLDDDQEVGWWTLVSGFTCVVPLREGDAERVREQGRLLAAAYRSLRPGTPSSATLDDGPVHVTAFGRVDVTADERGWTLRQGVLHGPRTHPVKAGQVPELDGQGSLVSYDAANGTTVIATDRFAAAPVYVAERDGLLCCATSAMVLARHLRSPADHLGLSTFLVAGYQYGPLTHWQGVRRLEPGTLLEVQAPGPVREDVYWRPHTLEEVERLDFDDAVDRVVDVATATLRERLGSREPWVDLTGGYDSRLLAVLLDRAGVSFAGNTRMSSLGPDIELAEEISDLMGWPWRPTPLPDDWPQQLSKTVDHALAAGDGRLEVLQLSRVAWIHQQLAQERPSLLSAGGGEHHQFYAWQSELMRPRRRPVDLGRWVDMLALKPTDLAALRPGLRDDVRRDMLERFQGRLDLLPGEPKTRQLDACYAYKTSGHFGAYRAADDVDITAELPFFYEPLFTTAFSLQAHHRDGMRIARAVIHRLNPRVAAIQTTRGGPATPMRPRSAVKYLPFYALLGRKGYNKVTERVFGRPLWPFPGREYELEDEANAAVVRMLQERGELDWGSLRVAPLLSADGVGRLQAGDVQPDMLGRVLTAEMALAATGSGL